MHDLREVLIPQMTILELCDNCFGKGIIEMVTRNCMIQVSFNSD